QARDRETVDVVGPICESGDFLAKDRELTRAEPEDLLAVMSAGAYGFVMASNYNTRPRAVQGLVDGNRYTIVRRRETYEGLGAGTGPNSTAEAVDLPRHAERAGAAGALVGNPYYNKPTQEGLYRHFRAVAESVAIPILLYNIQSRTAINVETDTMARLVRDAK